MSVRIITDSACDLDAAACEALRVDRMEIPVFFGEERYVEGENLTRAAFYEKLAAAERLPKTAQITPAAFEERFAPYVEAGEELVVLPLSKEMSGTYQSACIARDMYPQASIHVVDTRQVTFGLALLVRMAAAMRDDGWGGARMAEELHRLADRVRLYAVIDDLKYLKLGGRLSSTGAVVGALLGIKPLIAIEEGKVVGIHKARGQRAGFARVVELTVAAGIDESLPVYVGHSHQPEAADALREAAAGVLAGCADVKTIGIGPVVGTHAGPGCAGIAFFTKEAKA